MPATLSKSVAERRAAILERAEKIRNRKKLRIGIPRVLNQYSQNPFFSAYFEALGIPANNIIYSDFTSEELYKEGAKRGAICKSVASEPVRLDETMVKLVECIH